MTIDKFRPKTGKNGWEQMDSNHRRCNQQIYSLPHLAALEYSQLRASRGTRTPDQLITNQLLYQLSYTGLLIVFSKSITGKRTFVIADFLADFSLPKAVSQKALQRYSNFKTVQTFLKKNYFFNFYLSFQTFQTSTAFAFVTPSSIWAEAVEVPQKKPCGN